MRSGRVYALSGARVALRRVRPSGPGTARVELSLMRPDGTDRVWVTEGESFPVGGDRWTLDRVDHADGADPVAWIVER
jgi:hypothetical protein